MSDDSKAFRVRDRRGGDRYFVDNLFLRGGYAARVGAYGIAVYNALCLFANADTQEAWPSHRTIARLTGMSRMQVTRCIHDLVAMNLVQVEGVIGRSNTYTLLHRESWKTIPATGSYTGCNYQLLGVPLPVTGGVTSSYTNKTNEQDESEQDEMNNSGCPEIWKRVCAAADGLTARDRDMVGACRVVGGGDASLVVRAGPEGLPYGIRWVLQRALWQVAGSDIMLTVE